MSKQENSNPSASPQKNESGNFMGAERRESTRQLTDTVHICDLTSVNSFTVIARDGYIIDASSVGFLVHINRRDIVPKDLKENLTLDSLIGQQVVLYLPEMNLDLDGTISRTSHKGKGHFEVAIEFSDEVPTYWRECLVELLPKPGELES